VPFPGNVRQLENLCHWLTVMAPGQMVGLEDLPPELRQDALSASQAGGVTAVAPAITVMASGQANGWIDHLSEMVDQLLATAQEREVRIFEMLSQDFERTLIARALRHTGGRRIEAAQLLGIGRNTITRKIQELKIDEDAPSKTNPAAH